MPLPGRSEVMEFHFITINALDPQPGQEELNRLCAERRVAAVDRQFVTAGLDSFWSVCVAIAPGPGPLPASLKSSGRRAGSGNGKAGPSRIDYKEVLSEEDFAAFADLRKWRKQVAEVEGVPLYAVFTNEQLAEIVRHRVDTLAALGEIDGIGPARIERYGAAVLERLQAVPPATG